MDSTKGPGTEDGEKGAMTVSALFEFGIMSEQAARDFYDGLAGKFGHEPSVSDFWKTMAADEREHVRILENIRKTLTTEQLAAPVDPYIFEAAVENAGIRLADVLGMVRNLNDAYVLAHLWENSEVNRVFEFLVMKFIPVADDGRLIRLQVINHKNRLVMFSEAFGEVGLRKKIEAV